MTPRRALVVLILVGGLAAFLHGAPGAGDGPNPATAVPPPATGAETVVYYFHGNARCTTCRTIEAYANEAVELGFGQELADGTLSWRVVNVEPPENRHFIQDFQLVTRSVVLAEYRDGTVVRFENLDQVWQLVRNKQRFVDYVQSETKAFLGAS